MSGRIHPTAIVDSSAELGPDVEVGPWCMIGPGVRLDAGVELIANVHIHGWTHLMEGVRAHPYCVIGGPPQDLSYKGEETRLEIGARTVVREHATLHRGTVRGKSLTKVGADCFIMSQAHVAHDCVVGDGVVLAQAATLGGHVQLDDYVFLGGLCAIHQYGRVGRHAFVGGLAAVVADVIPYGSAFGNHAHLAGLNIVGMKRRKLAREVIHDLRAAYRLLFAEEGTFQERLEDVAQTYADRDEVMEIVNFIRSDASRPLCMPRD